MAGILSLLLWNMISVFISLGIPSMTTAVLLMVLMLTLVALHGWYRIYVAKDLWMIWTFVMPYLTDTKGEVEKLRRAIEESHLLGASAWAGKVLDFVDGYSYLFPIYGGTGMLVTNILLGILLSIYRYENIPLVIPDVRRRILRIH